MWRNELFSSKDLQQKYSITQYQIRKENIRCIKLFFQWAFFHFKISTQVYLRLDFSLSFITENHSFKDFDIEITLLLLMQSVLTKWNDNSLDVWFIAFDLLLFECYIVLVLLHLWMILEITCCMNLTKPGLEVDG